MWRKHTTQLVTLIAVGVILAIPASGAGSFDDDDGNVHETAIEAIALEGITKGCNPPVNDRFCPDEPVTRAQMATFMQRAFDLPAAPGGGFDDDDDSVHEPAIEAMAAAGITKGCNPPANTRFCPDDPVTRAQMATFLVQALGLSDDGGGDLFGDDDGSVHEASIDRLGASGITKGCNPPSNTRFCPDEPVTRAQMATFLMRAVGLEPVTPDPTLPPGGDDHALVSRFHVIRNETDRTNPYSVRNMGYWPRSFIPGVDINPVPGTEGWQVDQVDDPGAYARWDALSPGTSWGFDEYGPNDSWFQFTLNRPAEVAVVWRDDAPPPSWLQGWTEGTTVRVDGHYAPVYERSFPAGRVELGTVEGSVTDRRTMYLVLLAEDGGGPTPNPDTPGSHALPTPGEPCPSWVHGLHVTTGPDGQTYQTWHPQWDPVYWCSFGHEHGSNPGLIPGRPLVPYAYVADKVPQDEHDAGFKEFIFQDLSGEHWVRFVAHAGSSADRRVCTQFHTLYVQVYDLDGTELMNVGFKADYGAAVDAETDAALQRPCPDAPTMQQLLNDLGPERVRELNVAGQPHNYERWLSMDDTPATRNLGFGSFRHGFDIRRPMTQCVDIVCNQISGIGDPDFENGTSRALDMSAWRDPFIFYAGGQSLATGEFFTDPYGLGLVSPGASNATRQYVDPAVAAVDFLIDPAVNRIMCVPEDPWTMFYDCIQMTDTTPFPHVDDMNIQYSIHHN